MGRNGYTAYTDATVQRYNRDLSVAQGQLNKLYDDYRELESLYNGLDEDIMQWDTEQDHVEQATDQQECGKVSEEINMMSICGTLWELCFSNIHLLMNR